MSRLQPVVVSFHTGGAYACEAVELAISLEESRVRDYYIDQREDLGTWELNCHQKPAFLLDMIERFSPRAILWLDADARVRGPLYALGKIQAHIAYHRWRGREVLSGTILLRNNLKTLEVLERWLAISQEKPMEWDQRTFAQAITETRGLDAVLLGVEWCWIEGLAERYHKDVEPVIVQTQASRRLKT